MHLIKYCRKTACRFDFNRAGAVSILISPRRHRGHRGTIFLLDPAVGGTIQQKLAVLRAGSVTISVFCREAAEFHSPGVVSRPGKNKLSP